MRVAPSSSISVRFGGARLHLFVVLVFDAAHELLEHVFHGQHAGDGAELIHHHRHVRMAGAEFFEQLRKRLGLGHHQVRPQQAPDAKRAARAACADGVAPLFPNRQQIFVVQNADDLFRLLFLHRQARMLFLDHGAQHLVERGFGVDGDDIVARHHDLARDHGFEVEHAVDHILLRFG